MTKEIPALYIEASNNNQCKISITPSTSAAQAFQLLGTLASHILHAYTQAALTTLNPLESSTAAALEGIRLSLVDSLNILMTNVINEFDPTRQSFIDQIEEQAIIELTNQKVEEYYQSLTPEQQQDYAKSYNAIKEQLKHAETEA